MRRFIAYFDYLGFKDFIENNDLSEQKKSMANIYRDIESALGQDNTNDMPHGVVADLSKSKINCINFSDTVVFFTNDDTKESLHELLEVAYKFNWQAIDFFFPVRGALVYGELVYVDYKEQNSHGGVYNINSVFGKGLVSAHIKAESQNWAGTVIDQSFVNQMNNMGLDSEVLLINYAKKYKVPYKDGIEEPDEYVLNIIKGTLNEEAFKNFGKGVTDNFENLNKSTDHPSVQIKLNNTLHFLKSYLDRVK